MVTSSDVAKTSELMLADAKVQIAEEPQAPSFTMMGQCEKTNTRENPPTPDAKKELIFWYARFASKDAYMIDHRNRESNKTFAKKFMAGFASFPKDDPTNVDKIMAAVRRADLGAATCRVVDLRRASRALSWRAGEAWGWLFCALPSPTDRARPPPSVPMPHAHRVPPRAEAVEPASGARRAGTRTR